MSRRIAVIGSGVAGLVATHVLARDHEVTVYEADGRPGGHAHTHQVPLSDGRTVAVDSGFIVHNDRTYPTLLRLFEDLGVDTQETDMSMSISGGPQGWQYAGGQGAGGILGDPRTAADPRFWRMLVEVKKFHRGASSLLAEPAGADGDLLTFGDWLDDLGFSATFLQMFARPLVAAVWSCDAADALRYPARSLLTFLDHHGMLTVSGSPTWRTVQGGSGRYVDRVLQAAHQVRLHSAASRLERTEAGVVVTDPQGSQAFDAAVIATHPHQALAMLADPTPLENSLLSAITYSRNTAHLHTDDSVLPRARRVQASWNYRVPPPIADGSGVLVSYDLTRLMRLPSPGGERILVTLNGSEHIRPDRVIAEMNYEHPLYTREAVLAQRQLHELGDQRLAFAGAYHGSGFHEDGAASGLAAAQALGGRW